MGNAKTTHWIIIVAIGILICFMTASPSLAKKPSKGQVAVAVGGAPPIKGADCHTARASGAYPIMSMVHQGLVMKLKDGRIHPCLAKSWTIDPNWGHVKFVMNEKARFHDGTTVKGEDVKFSFERAMRPELKFVYGGEFKRNIKSIEVIDDMNVTVHCNGPYPAFLERLATYFHIVPKHYVEKVGDETFAAKAIGAGPFKWVDYKQDQWSLMEAVEEHWRKTPHVKSVYLMNVQEDATRLAMLKTGEIDMSMLTEPQIPAVKADPNLRLYWVKNTFLRELTYCDLAFPKEPSPWHDIRVRRAALHAIDREAICKNVMQGRGTVHNDIFAPYTTGYDPNIKPISYNIEKAKALLEEAGYPNGFDTEIVTGPTGRTATEAIAASLKKANIRAKLVVPEHAMWLRLMFEKKYRGLHYGFLWWEGRSHPQVAIGASLDPTNKYCYFNTPEIAAEFAKLESMVDEKEIEDLARKVSRMYRGHLVRGPLWAINAPFGLGPRIKYWENVPGWFHPVLFEYLILNE